MCALRVLPSCITNRNEEQCPVIPLKRDTFGTVFEYEGQISVVPAEQRRAFCLPLLQGKTA
jgi:hypothetical protein